MPRKGPAPRRELLPDPKYRSLLVTQVINKVLQRGKRSVAEKIMYEALDQIEQKTGSDPVAAQRQLSELLATPETLLPAERLLVWKPEEGVAPIADFLEVARPAEELPRLNDTKAFREGIIGGALDSVTEWWDSREKSSEGLHGAAVS